MPDFTVRADSVNVEQVMDQIRARIREKRGVDYTEQQIREMATAKLEKFLDPRGVRSDLLDRFRNAQPVYTPPELPNYAFEAETLFESHRGPLHAIRRLLQPVLKLFFNPGPLIQALNIQSRLNTLQGEREARREAARHGMDQLYYEVMHNLVVETTRMAIEVKNLKMKVESLTSRLEFNERRARALESVVVYKPLDGSSIAADMAPPPTDATAVAEPAAPAATHLVAVPGSVASAAAAPGEGPGQRSRRRRRRRGRRGSGSAVAIMGGATGGQTSGSSSHDGVDDGTEVDGAGVEGEEFDGGPDASSDAPHAGSDTSIEVASTPAPAGDRGAATPAEPADAVDAAPQDPDHP